VDDGKKVIISIFSILLLAIIGIAPLKISAVSSAQAPWNGVDGNYPLNWDYSPQTQFGASNVQNLQVSWIYPVPSSPGAYGPIDDGVVITPIVVSGISYVVTNYPPHYR